MKIVWHCEDVVGARMAGPGIRAVELSRRLAQKHEVTLVAEGARPVAELSQALRGADVFVSQGFGFPLRALVRFRGRVVLDLYDPVQLEHLARAGETPTREQLLSLAVLRRRLQYVIGRADHILCASRPQRALWLGWLGALGRLTPEALRGDPEASRLLSVVPFGVPEQPPVRTRSPLRTSPDAIIALWSGGMWDWMDPALAVRAARIAQRRVPRLKLALLAGARPGSPDMNMRGALREARAAAEGAPFVQFVDEWVPYEERGAWLLDADFAVSAHKPSLEAELAFRTRLLDCLWAGLPVVCTGGDVLAQEGEQQGWAKTSAPGDAEAMAAAMCLLAEPQQSARMREAARKAGAERTWQRSADTLLALLDGPAPERAAFKPSLAFTAAKKVLRKLKR